jgi:hypothetical protein
VSPSFSVGDLLPELGFQPASQGSLHDWEYRHEGMDLSVIEGVNRCFQLSLHFDGTFSDGRTMRLIEFDVNPQAESREQAVALIGYYLGSTPFRAPPAWLIEAQSLHEHLPWVAERRAYEARERCHIEREWARLPIKKLRLLAATAHAEDDAVFSFDGEVLRVETLGEVLAVPASGAAWASPVSVPLSTLQHLPKRLMNSPVSVDLWQGNLRVAGLRLPVLTTSDRDERA